MIWQRWQKPQQKQQQQQQQQQQQNNNNNNKNSNKNSNNNQPVLVKQIPEKAKKLNGLGMIRVGRFFQHFSAFWKINIERTFVKYIM